MTSIEQSYWESIRRIDYPFAQAIHGDAQWLEDEILVWCRGHGLAVTRMLEQQIRAARLAEFISRANADVSRPMLRLVGLWTVWFFLSDDITDSSTSTESLADFHARVLAVVAGETATGDSFPLVQAAADLGDELRRSVGAITRVRFQRALAQTFEAHSWEVANQLADRQPDSMTYHTMRIWSGAFLPMIALVDVVRGYVLPPYLFELALMRELIDEANRTVLWYNDLWSYPKEAAANRARHNIVHIMAHEYQLPVSHALELAIAQHNASLARYLSLREEVLMLGEETELVLQFINGVEAWLRATQDWSHQTARYQLERAVNA